MEAIKNPQVEIGARLLEAAADLRLRAMLVAQKSERGHRPGFFGVFHFPSHGCGGRRKKDGFSPSFFSDVCPFGASDVRFANDVCPDGQVMCFPLENDKEAFCTKRLFFICGAFLKKPPHTPKNFPKKDIKSFPPGGSVTPQEGKPKAQADWLGGTYAAAKWIREAKTIGARANS